MSENIDRRRRLSKIRVSLLLLCLGLAPTVSGQAAPSSGASTGSASAAARFGAPVKVTPQLGGGYEPTVLADKYGNIFGTAHKEN